MSETINAGLLLADAALYFAILAILFRMRARIGIGAFFCALGVMHFLETYLASTFYVALPFGLTASPGSTVLFTGKLMLLLLVYIREDAVVVRQPIYGLLIGNVLLIATAFLMRFHALEPLSPERQVDFSLLGEMGALMVWGTLVLFVDCILMILAYERSRGLLGGRVFARIALTGAVILSFDQVAFFAGLHMLTGAPSSVLVGGWLAKMAFVLVYAGLVTAYLTWVERTRGERAEGSARIADIFDLLTYRERYEDLVARSGRDALSGAFDRGRLESEGPRRVAEAVQSGHPLSLLIIDIDHFKSFNDRFGHAAGDAVIKRIAAAIMANVRTGDAVFRYGGEEFVVIAEGLAASQASILGERIRRAIAGDTHAPGQSVTASIGVAACAEDASDYLALFKIADDRLYQAKSEGRNCVVGAALHESEKSVRLVYSGW